MFWRSDSQTSPTASLLAHSVRITDEGMCTDVPITAITKISPSDVLHWAGIIIA